MTQQHEQTQTAKDVRRGSPQRRLWGTALAGGLIGLLAACDSPRPPTGIVLSLKGNKGALCVVNRECASNECLAGHCTEKIEKVGLGGECKSDRYCKAGFYCDTKAKKCAPVVRCEDAGDRLRQCIQEVYLAFRPSQRRALLRTSARYRARLLDRARRRLYRSLCQLTRDNGLSFERAVGLQKALQITDCPKFAAAFHKAVGK